MSYTSSYDSMIRMLEHEIRFYQRSTVALRRHLYHLDELMGILPGRGASNAAKQFMAVSMRDVLTRTATHLSRFSIV